jgi:chromosome partitioning protein
MGNRELAVLAVANQKGGVGKTTTALSLAAAFSLQGSKTLVLDLDPHASATIHLAFDPDGGGGSVINLFNGSSSGEIWQHNIRREDWLLFDFVPGSIRLSDLETDLKDLQGKGILLQRSLKHILPEYDYIILDCPPQLGVILVNALVASNLTIIPIQTEFLALHGLRLLFDTMRMLNKALPEPIHYKALATMYDRRVSASHRVFSILRRKLGERIFSTVIHVDTKLREASAQGKVIFDIAPKSQASREYLQLAKEIAQL